MQYLPGIFALIVLAAGWYYLLYSPAARRLSGIESGPRNILRVRLRRANGLVMMLLAVAFYALMYTVRDDDSRAFGWVTLCIIVLLSVMMVLALIDIHLTRKLRQERRKREHEP
jgi:peptidoglycan/LPS O-acetylase OafA/YrhL